MQRLDSDATPCTGCAVGKRGGLTLDRPPPRGSLLPLEDELELDELLDDEDRDLLLRDEPGRRVKSLDPEGGQLFMIWSISLCSYSREITQLNSNA